MTRQFGQWEGKVVVGPGFDEADEEIARPFGLGSVELAADATARVAVTAADEPGPETAGAPPSSADAGAAMVDRSGGPIDA